MLVFICAVNRDKQAGCQIVQRNKLSDEVHPDNLWCVMLMCDVICIDFFLDVGLHDFAVTHAMDLFALAFAF